jgi:hypothetical protein
MKKETPDFIQVDYALDNRNAGERILPLAADRGMAVRGQVQGQELYRHRDLSSGDQVGAWSYAAWVFWDSPSLGSQSLPSHFLLRGWSIVCGSAEARKLARVDFA